MDRGIISTQPFTSAVEFLNALSPFHEDWRNSGSHPCWAFRGVSDASLSLQAKALRPGELKVYGIGVTSSVEPEDQRTQRRYEASALWEFVNKCIRAGLPIPEDSQWLRNVDLQQAAFKGTVEGCQISGVNFPFPLFRSLYALAQHYEVPTRLLDWSLSAYIAAYFACRGVAREMAMREMAKDEESKGEPRRTYGSAELCVWAIKTSVLQYELEGADPCIELVDAPAESNPNLKAQRGLFTLVKNRTAASAERPPPDLETLLQNADIERNGGEPSQGGNNPILRKYTLPHTKARHLLRLLAGAYVDAATIQPNYEGVATAMKEREFWSAEG